jgi:RNA polymerase sigma-70 factor (ECF subfamily)
MSATALSPSDEQLGSTVARRAASAAALRAAKVAFEELYRRHARALLAFLASRAPRADLEGLAQTVWARVWECLPEDLTQGGFRGWLFQVARRLVIDQARRRKPDPLPEDVEPPDPGGCSPLEVLIGEERRAKLESCLGKLKPSIADIVRARMAGEDYEAICTRLGLSHGRAYSLFHSARGLLQKCCAERSSHETDRADDPR